MNISAMSASALLAATSDKSHNNAKPAMQRPLSSINIGLNNAQPVLPKPVGTIGIGSGGPQHGGPVTIDQLI